MATEQQVKMAAKLYECRDGVKNLAQITDRTYPEIIKDEMDILKGIMAKEKKNAIQALFVVAETNTYKENGMCQMKFLAAVCEILEPSK